jgi:hypothetical protein
MAVISDTMARKVRIRVCFQFRYDWWEYRDIDRWFLLRTRELTKSRIQTVNSTDSIKFSFVQDYNNKNCSPDAEISDRRSFITSGFIHVYKGQADSNYLSFPQFWISNIYV